MNCCTMSWCDREGAHRINSATLLCCDHFEQYVDARFHVPRGSYFAGAQFNATIGQPMELVITLRFIPGGEGARAQQAILNPGKLALPAPTRNALH